VRIVLDTNILVSALIVPGGPSDYLYQCWRSGRFVLLTGEDHLDEFRRVTRYPRLQKYIRPAAAGTMLNEIRALAEMAGVLPNVSVCVDPADNFLLAMAEAGQADYLVTGDERHLLSIRRHRTTHIVSAREMVRKLG
jgi:putative PIN family toxin of toxin-antitoxin system